MQRSLLLLLLVALATGAAGCAGLLENGPYPSTGWRFEMGRPSVLASVSPALLQPQTGGIGVLPLGAGPPALPSSFSLPPSPVAPPVPVVREYLPAPRMQEAPDACSVREMCDMLRELIRRVPAPPRPE